MDASFVLQVYMRSSYLSPIGDFGEKGKPDDFQEKRVSIDNVIWNYNMQEGKKIY